MTALHKYKLIDTSESSIQDPDHLLQVMVPFNHGFRNLQIPQGKAAWRAIVHAVSLGQSVIAATSVTSVTADFNPTGRLYLAAPLRTPMEYRYGNKHGTIHAGSTFAHTAEGLSTAVADNFAQVAFNTPIDAIVRLVSNEMDQQADSMIHHVQDHHGRLDFTNYQKTLKFVVAALDSGADTLIDQQRFLAAAEEMLLLSIAGAFVPQSPAQSTHASKFLRRAIAYIEDHLTADLSLIAIAQHAQCGVRSLQQAFKSQLDKTVVQYITERRLARAQKRLLAPRSDDSVTTIAYSCGFNHLGIFAQRYRAAFGEAPSKTLGTSRQR